MFYRPARYISMENKFVLYKNWLAQQRLSPATKQSYERAVANFCRHLHHNGELEPTAENIRAYFALLQETYSNSSQAAFLAAIRSYCQFHGLAMPHVPVAPRHGNRPRTLSEAECEQLMKAIVNYSNCKTATLIAVFLQCGLKIGEVSALDASDVSLVHSRIVIAVRKEQDIRRLPMNDLGTRLMLDWLAKRVLLRPDADEKALFINNAGARLSASGINSLMDAFAKQAGITFNARILRNTCLKQFVIQTGNVKSVAEFAGYKSSKGESLLIRMCSAVM